MELDELKENWNKLQQQQKELSTHTINKIIMNTNITINEMKQKNSYWNNFAKVVFPVLIVILIIDVAIGYFAPAPHTTFLSRVSYALIMIIFAVASLYMYRWQENILNYYNAGDLKASLVKTIKDFRRFYLFYNLIYLVLYPAYFYAMFKLLVNVALHLSENTTLISSAVLSILSIVAGHIYYRLTYFKRIRSLEADLQELES
jgi:hypothetical protein